MKRYHEKYFRFSRKNYRDKIFRFHKRIPSIKKLFRFHKEKPLAQEDPVFDDDPIDIMFR